MKIKNDSNTIKHKNICIAKFIFIIAKNQVKICYCRHNPILLPFSNTALLSNRPDKEETELQSVIQDSGILFGLFEKRGR